MNRFARNRLLCRWSFTLMTGCLLGWMSCSRPYLTGDYDFNPRSMWVWGGGPERNGSGAQEVVPPLRLAWIYRANAAIEKGICAADSFLFFGDKGGEVTILHQRQGKSVRSIQIQKRMGVTCLPHGRHLIIAMRWGKETLRSIDMTTGKTKWAIRAGGIEGEPLLVDNRLFIGNILGKVSAFDPDTGTLLWERNLHTAIVSSFALTGGLLICTTENGSVWSLSASDGTMNWNTVLLDPIAASPVLLNNKIYFGTQSGVFYCLDSTSGRVIWQKSCRGSIFATAAAVGEEVYFGTSQGILYSLDAHEGTLRWQFETGSVVGTSPLVSGQIVYFGTLDKMLYAVRRLTGEEVWMFETRGRIRTDPVIWNEMLVIASENHFVYGFVQE